MNFFRSIVHFTQTRKFWIAITSAVGVFVSTLSGVDIGLDENTSTALVNLAIGLAGAWGVWRATNAPAE